MSTAPTEPVTVVIVDDEPHVRALIVASLTPLGYRLLEAGDGETAWGLVRAHRPAVLVSNRRMPGRSGPDLARAIKADPATANTHVIIVSGVTDDADIEEIQQSGADRFIPKPFAPRELAQAVIEGVLYRSGTGTGTRDDT